MKTMIKISDNELPTEVTLDHTNSVIADKFFIHMPLSTVTVCRLQLVNGASVAGIDYGSMDPNKQDWGRAQEDAYNDAVKKVFVLENYLLRQKHFEAKK